MGAPARFTVETFSAGKGEVEVIILNPKGAKEPVSRENREEIKMKRREEKRKGGSERER